MGMLEQLTIYINDKMDGFIMENYPHTLSQHLVHVL